VYLSDEREFFVFTFSWQIENELHARQLEELPAGNCICVQMQINK